jgi:hypothetical protein
VASCSRTSRAARTPRDPAATAWPARTRRRARTRSIEHLIDPFAPTAQPPPQPRSDTDIVGPIVTGDAQSPDERAIVVRLMPRPARVRRLRPVSSQPRAGGVSTARRHAGPAGATLTEQFGKRTPRSNRLDRSAATTAWTAGDPQDPSGLTSVCSKQSRHDRRGRDREMRTAEMRAQGGHRRQRQERVAEPVRRTNDES